MIQSSHYFHIQYVISHLKKFVHAIQHAHRITTNIQKQFLRVINHLLSLKIQALTDTKNTEVSFIKIIQGKFDCCLLLHRKLAGQLLSKFSFFLNDKFDNKVVIKYVCQKNSSLKKFRML